ncbi:MAG TPA: hypothetical protein PLT68_09510, partial [Actinomycetota bacterium]|nr:hypothetical protein [Actinomycetota bacterium]
PVTIAVSPTTLASVEDVSYTGRYVVASGPKARLQLRDLRKGKRLVQLPKGATAASLSQDGRYLAYSMPVGPWARRKILVYDRKRERTTNVTRRTNGKVLVPSWNGSCTPARCEEDQKLIDEPQLRGGQISGNGRYVVFSANFREPAVIDVYVKNLKTGKLQIFKDVGQVYNSEGDAEYVQAPSISHDGSVILIPGRLDSYESQTTWGPGRALFDRSRLVEIGGAGNVMTRDGRIISISGGPTGSGYRTPDDVVWRDVVAGTDTPADPPSMRMSRTNASADGRYVFWRPNPADPLQLRDRTLGVGYDLGTALTDAGYQPDRWIGYQGSYLWGVLNSDAGISGDGRTLFLTTDGDGIVKVTWTP